MSLYFVNTISIPNTVPRRARDDFDLQPVRLAGLQVNPLTTSFPAELIAKTWRLATVGKHVLLNGARYENALWRVWAQQRLKISKVDGLGIDWDDGKLFVPLVVSSKICHSRHDLSLISTAQNTWPDQAVEAFQLLTPVSTAIDDVGMEGSLTLSIKSCLKHSSSTERSDSPLSFRRDPTPSPSIHPKRGVIFNSCVAQSLIVDGLSEDEISDDDMLVLPPTRGRRSRFHDAHRHGDSKDYSSFATPTNSSSTIMQKMDVTLIQPLPPTRLVPRPRTWESNVVYVPLSGADGGGGEHRGRSTLPKKSLTRVRSSWDLRPKYARSCEREVDVAPSGAKARFSIAVGGDSDEGESEEDLEETFTMVEAVAHDGNDEDDNDAKGPISLGFFASFGSSVVRNMLGSLL